MFDVGVPELLIILVILVLVFGGSRVAELGGALGKSVREFRNAVEGRSEDKPSQSAQSEQQSQKPA